MFAVILDWIHKRSQTGIANEQMDKLVMTLSPCPE